MRKLLDILCALGLLLIAGIFGLGVWQAIIVPAISHHIEWRELMKTKVEASSLLKYLYEYAEKSPDKKFPLSFNMLDGEELKRRGISGVAKLQETYWFFPCSVNGKWSKDALVLITTTNHYSRMGGGIIAYNGPKYGDYFVTRRYGKEYMYLLMKYCNGPTMTNTINRREADENCSNSPPVRLKKDRGEAVGEGRGGRGVEN